MTADSVDDADLANQAMIVAWVGGEYILYVSVPR